MKERDPRFVVGGKPVNRRTAARAPGTPKVAAKARERAAAVLAKRRLGAPLADQLGRKNASARPALWASAAGAGAVSAFGAMQGSLLLAGGALIAAAALGIAAWRRPDTGTATPSLFDEDTLRAFDTAVAAAAPGLPEEAARRLIDLKHRIVRIARQPGAAQPDEHFTADDRGYVVECVRRYIPDALQAFLSVPPAQRAATVAEGETPQAVLGRQLELLDAALQEREARLARGAAEALLRQERFLKSKG